MAAAPVTDAHGEPTARAAHQPSAPPTPSTPSTPSVPSAPSVPPVAGLLLAAGGGRRLGGTPKALLAHRGRPLVEHAARALREGGCAPVHVVLGAAEREVRDLAGPAGRPGGALSGCVLVGNPRWPEGMGTSLRAGLDSLAGTGAGAALVLLVDQPGIGAAAVARVVAAYRGPRSLVTASYGGRRGHPVLLGSAHWAGAAADARGDRGARGYLKAHEGEISAVECGDVASPYDIDTEEDLWRLAPPLPPRAPHPPHPPGH
ncbi:nucleotidyltransferase family protein [Streptomyces corynorhini]|uniref:Nucleotidyltransferase family protein n=1 Tax=Streptomyces corynorhini TaxID=2282652 RepID=A0A370B560_9ACTN|nr:NTP transferase domain-containing protein [Streptomyces corynorhini]RDG35509.1 nucleotidyltransferase family protein [Streptomyces corynorhini]